MANYVGMKYGIYLFLQYGDYRYLVKDGRVYIMGTGGLWSEEGERVKRGVEYPWQ